MNPQVNTTTTLRTTFIALASLFLIAGSHAGNCKFDLADPSGDSQDVSGDPVDFVSASAIFTDPEQDVFPEFILDIIFNHDVAAPSNPPPPIAGAPYQVFGLVFVDKDQN